MRIYLLRHGHAPSLAEAGVAYDADRPLSERGQSEVKRAVRWLLSRGGKPSLILHSPMKRAVQTAQVAAGLIRPDAAPETFPPLSNSMPAPELCEELKARSEGVSEMLAVGHQPQLGELALFLTNRIFELHPGGMIAIETMPAGGARTLWTANPFDIPEA